MAPCRLLTISTFLLLGILSLPSAADPLENTAAYQITIPADDHRVAIVTASMTPSDRTFYMFPGASQLPQRWSTFVSDFELVDERDQRIPVTAEEDGTWRMADVPQGPVTVRYRVNLEHENHAWSGGVDGAAYWREWGVFYTARALFIVNGDQRESITVGFDLPESWQVTTPWVKQSGEHTRFTVGDHDALATSMFFAGTHREVSVKEGPFELLLALGGEEILAQEKEFSDMAGGILDYYVELMGGVPRLREGTSETPVVIINQAEQTDGEAIGNNISILLEPGGGQMSQHIARLIFAHEFFHLWNGKSFTPNGEDAEWFKEGFTNYYAMKALHRIGYLDDAIFLDLLGGFFYQRYDGDDAVGSHSMTKGKLKHDHWGLIYAGGMLAGIAQDLQIRSVTNNEKSIDDLMRHMFDNFADDSYDLSDIERVLRDLNNAEQKDFFERFIVGVERLPVARFLALAGIEVVEEEARTLFRVREDSTAEADEIRRGMFGN